MWRYFLTTVIACLWLLLLSGCTGAKSDPPSVVVYVSADDHLARQVFAEFEKETNIKVRMVGDTEAKKTTALVMQLIAEKDAPQADVFWSSEIFQTVKLAEEGVLAPFESEATADWPEAFRDAGNLWYGFAARARVIVYAPDRVDPEDVPHRWLDLRNRNLKGRIVMADPRFGTTGGHLGAMRTFWDENESVGFYERMFLHSLATNEARILPSGNAGVVRAVISGEADLGLTDTDDVWAAQARGHNLELVYPAHGNEEGETGQGTLLIPNTIGLVAGGPNPEAAGRFIDFMLSEKVERILAESVSHNIPLGPGLADAYPEYAVPDPLVIDYHKAAACRADAVNAAMIQLGGVVGEPEKEDEGDAS